MDKKTRLLWHTSSNKIDSSLLLSIGEKAIGLLRIPEPWRPPFFVLPTEVYFDWQNARGDRRSPLAESSSATIAEGAARFGVEWNGGIIFRLEVLTGCLQKLGSLHAPALR